MPAIPQNRWLIGSLICLLGTGWVYGSTLAPVVQGFDSAELTVGAYTLGIVHPPGYPLYMLIGNWATHLPIGDVGFRLNLLSAALGVLAVLLIYRLLGLLTKHWLVAIVPTALVALAPYVWSQAIRAEVYMLHLSLVSAALLTWFIATRSDRPIYYVLSLALLGLASANHTTTLLLWIAFFAAADWKNPRQRWPIMGGALLGASSAAGFYLLYFAARTPQPWAVNYIQEYFGRDLREPANLLWMISGQAFRCASQLSIEPARWFGQLNRLWAFLWDGTLGFGLILAVWGWATLRRALPQWNRLLTVYFLSNLAAFLIYDVIDKQAMFLPVYLILGLWIGTGLDNIIAWLAARTRLHLQQIEYLAPLACLALIALSAALDWPTVSLKGNRQVYDFSQQVLQQAPSSSLIVNHWVTASMFDYLQIVAGQRPDVKSFNLDFYWLGAQKTCGSQASDQIEAAWAGWLAPKLQANLPLCFIEPLPSLPDRYQWVQNGLCWEPAPDR